MRKKNKKYLLAWTDLETTGLPSNPDTEAIEIAIIITDENLAEQGRFEALICPRMLREEHLGAQEWPPPYDRAHDVHGISVQILREKGLSASAVRERLNEYLEPFIEGDRVLVLASDNLVFEWHYMKKLLNGSWPFYYKGYDTNILEAVTGFADPEAKHRAMADVELLLDNVREVWHK